VRNNADFILGNGSETGVILAGFLDVLLALACIGTAVALFPVVKRQSESAALGFVASRVLEAAIIVVGVVSLFSVVTMRQDLSGADASTLTTAGSLLVAVHDWTFLLGPGVLAGVNALFLGYVMYKSGLVPRIIPTIGLIAAPIILASSTATMFGAYDQVSPWAQALAIPVGLWEVSLGVWLVVKGFKPSPITDGMATTANAPAYHGVAA
jgi:hypothetical protein